MRTFNIIIFLLVLITFVIAHRGHHKSDSNHQHNPSNDGIRNFFRLCGPDIETFCSAGKGTRPSKPQELFDSVCFKENEENLRPACRDLMTQWRQSQNQPQPNTPNTPNTPDQPALDLQQPPQPNDEDKDDDDKDDDGDDDDEEGSAQGTRFYEACHADRVKLCPTMQDDVRAKVFFESKCFQEGHHTQGVTSTCKEYYKTYVKQRAIAFGVLVTGSFAILFGGLLGCLALVCCVTCCIRVRRRNCRARCMKAKLVKKTEPNLVNELNGIPMQAFTSTSTATSPYSAYPQYWQPMLYAAVPTEESV